jgi:hypothetical protein
LGGTAANFDTIGLHTLPNPRPPEEVWPDLKPDEQETTIAARQRMARENPSYYALAEDECGRYEVAGKSIAVPFVGAVAATLVIAEALRVFHQGPAYSDLKLSLSAIDMRLAKPTRTYNNQDLAGLIYCNCRKVEPPYRTAGQLAPE